MALYFISSLRDGSFANTFQGACCLLTVMGSFLSQHARACAVHPGLLWSRVEPTDTHIVHGTILAEDDICFPSLIGNGFLPLSPCSGFDPPLSISEAILPTLTSCLPLTLGEP